MGTVQALCASPAGVLAFLDLHAHSRRHGVFTLSNPGTETLPDILAKAAGPLFDRRRCTFRSEASKRGSARSAVWRELGITHAHTVESTYAATPDLAQLVTPRDLADIGRSLVRGCARLQERKCQRPTKKLSSLVRKAPKKSGGPVFKLVM